jgi:hypothetical protein
MDLFEPLASTATEVLAALRRVSVFALALDVKDKCLQLGSTTRVNSSQYFRVLTRGRAHPRS